MKKSLILVLFLSMFLILAGCRNQNNTDVDTDDEIVVDETVSEEEIQATMEEIYKKGGKMTCTMSSTEDGVQMNWTLYINWKELRSTVQWNVEWMNFKMTTLIKDEYSYTWNDTSSEGRKFPYSEEDEEDMEEWLNDAATDTDMDTKMSFKCKKGIEWSNLFDLPSNIKFSEMPQY